MILLTCLFPIMMHPVYDEQVPLESMDTAVTGVLIDETPDSYLIDFSEYARKHKYDVRATKVWVFKDLCMEENLK